MPAGKCSKSVMKLAVSVLLFGTAFTFGVAGDYERPKMLCLALAAALLLPRALRQWSTMPTAARLGVLLMLVVLLLSTVFSLDTSRSLMGSFDRSLGVSAWLAAVIVACARVPLTFWRMPMLIVATLASIYALLQFVGLDPVHQAPEFQHRVFASFGNPLIFADWLLLALPFAWHACEGKSKIWRWLLFALLGLALCLTQSRMAWIALAVVALLHFAKTSPGFDWRLIAVMALVTVAISLSTARRTESIQARWLLWQHSATTLVSTPILIDGLGAPDPYPVLRPWIGFGADMQAAVLDRLAAPAVGQSHDRAHQFFLDWYLQFGYLGIVLSLWGISRLIQHCQGAQRWALIGVLIAWQTGFVSTASLALLALIVGAKADDQPSAMAQDQIDATCTQSRSMQSVLCSSALILLSLASFAPLGSWQVRISWRKPEQAVSLYQQAQQGAAHCPITLVKGALQHDRWRIDLQRAVETLAAAPICQSMHPRNLKE